MNRGRLLSALGLAITIGATAPGCLVTAQGRMSGGAVVAYDAPPPPREEPVEMRPGYVWIHGRWDWQGGQWQWMSGHWERERAGYAWREGTWVQQGNQWRWNDGQWIVAGGVAVTATTTNTGAVVADHPVVDRNGQPLGNGGGNSMYPMQPPPPAQVENPGMRGGYVWVSGYYQWGGGQYQWVPGHWERERANMVWQAGHWDLQGDHYVWIEGQWVAGGGSGPRDHRH